MIIDSIKALRERLKGETSVGFVPTMGYLHDGHLSLIKAARKENDVVVVSIFVNPTQFAPNEDFESYPRDLERDNALAMEAGADIVFYPDVEEMYVGGYSTYVMVEGELTRKLCGASRPTHFKGVTSVVTILFNIVKPHRAYFGQKDAQQSIIIKKMVRDLHMDVDVIVCPIVRESDGLAMSSRNVYLSDEERRQALALNLSLRAAKQAVQDGESDPEKLKGQIRKKIESMPLANVDYVEVLSGYDLSDVRKMTAAAGSDKDLVLAAVAVKFGNTRLIDNMFMNGQEV